MKKALLTISMLPLFGMIISCEKTDAKDSSESSGVSVDSDSLSNTSTSLNVGDSSSVISEFLQSHYPSGTEYRTFFEDNEESQCLVINTTEELLNNYIGIDSFPDIDFNRYTLVVGQEIMPESYYTILRQELRPIGDEFILYIYVPELDGWFCSVQHLFYWGIYPKMQSPKITVEIIKERL